MFSPNRPTGSICSSSRDVRPCVVICCLLSPSQAILPGEQRRSQGSKAVSYRGISTLKKCTMGLVIHIFSFLQKIFFFISPVFDASGATSRISREIRCLPYPRFLHIYILFVFSIFSTVNILPSFRCNFFEKCL